MSMALIETHFSRLKDRFPEATLVKLPSGAGLISVPHHPLPSGWSAVEVMMRFVAPNGYTVAAPDCFWVEPNLTLANGATPKNSQHNNAIPETNLKGHWFSWHVQQGAWSPNHHDLLCWHRACCGRLERFE